MAKIKWDRVKQENRRTREYDLLINSYWNKRKKIVNPMSEKFNKLFNLALTASSGSKHYKSVLSMQKQFLKKGHLSEKQGKYLISLAGLNGVKNDQYT